MIVVATADFEVYHGVVNELRDRGVTFTTLEPDEELPERTEREEGEALRAVGRQLAHLLSLARKHDIAVAFTNQVFSDPDSDQARALGGHTLNHWSATILRVDRFRGGNRRATLEKHRAKAAGEKAQFTITDNGLESGESR